MFKLIAFFALVAVAYAAPGYLGGVAPVALAAPVAYGAPVAYAGHGIAAVPLGYAGYGGIIKSHGIIG